LSDGVLDMVGETPPATVRLRANVFVSTVTVRGRRPTSFAEGHPRGR